MEAHLLIVPLIRHLPVGGLLKSWFLPMFSWGRCRAHGPVTVLSCADSQAAQMSDLTVIQIKKVAYLNQSFAITAHWSRGTLRARLNAKVKVNIKINPLECLLTNITINYSVKLIIKCNARSWLCCVCRFASASGQISAFLMLFCFQYKPEKWFGPNPDGVNG